VITDVIPLDPRVTMPTEDLKGILNSLRTVTGYEEFCELTNRKEIVKMINAEGSWRLGSVLSENDLSLASDVNISGVSGKFADQISLRANDADDALRTNVDDPRFADAFPSDTVAIAESTSGDIAFVIPHINGVWLYRHDEHSVDYMASDLTSWIADSEIMSASDSKFDAMHVCDAPPNLIGVWKAVESPHLDTKTVNAQPVIKIDEFRNWICDFPDSTFVFYGRYAIANKRKNRVAVLDEGEINRYTIVSIDENFLVLKGPDSGVIVKYQRL